MKTEVKERSPFTQYFNDVIKNATWNTVRILVSIPMLFFWGVFIALSFMLIAQAAISAQIIEDEVLVLILFFFVGMFFTPFEFMSALIMNWDYSSSGGMMSIIGAVSMWLAIWEFFRVLRKKFIPKKSDSLVKDVWSIYKTRMKFVASIFIFSVLINIISGNYEVVLTYLWLNFLLLPLSLSIILYHGYEQNTDSP